jgi:hypothetical protein
MEQMTIIRFFTLKAKAIQAELEFVYGKDPCKLFMVKKGEQLYLMIGGPDDPPGKIVLKQSSQ